MAPIPHVKLDGKTYMLTGFPTKTFAQQFAPAIGQGESKYKDGTSYAAWIQKTWTDGAGQLDPVENPGFLYAELETRIPNQLILPGRLRLGFAHNNGRSWMPDAWDDGPIITDDYPAVGQGDLLAFPFRTPTSWPTNLPYVMHVYILASAPPYSYRDVVPNTDLAGNEYIYLQIWSRGNPGAPLFESPVSVGAWATSDPLMWYRPLEPTYSWYRAEITLSTVEAPDILIPTSTNMYMSVSTHISLSHNYIQLATGSAPGEGTTPDKAWYGTAATVFVDPTWTAAPAGTFPSFFTSLDGWGPYSDSGWPGELGTGSGFFRFNGNLYGYGGNSLMVYDTVNDEWDYVDTFNDTDPFYINHAVPFGDLVFFSSFTENYMTMDESENLSSGAIIFQAFAQHKGFIWRASGNEVEYSDDGITWEPTTTYGAPITVGDPRFTVVNMCGLGEDMYCATEEGLFRIVPGDLAIPVAPWGSISLVNGQAMLNYQGGLYITVGGRVVRYTEDGRLQDVWLSMDDQGLDNRLGRVTRLCQMNNWLLAMVAPVSSAQGGNGTVTIIQAGVDDPETLVESDGAFPTIWAMQGSSWHQVSMLPPDTPTGDTTVSDYAMMYDRETQQLWSVTPILVPYRQYIPNIAVNPLNDPNYLFANQGWIEWDWFDGPIFDVYKDYESVTIIGEGFGPTKHAEVYWMDDDSDYWEFLGDATENLSELRWDYNRGDRPATRRFKLGMILHNTDDDSSSLRVRAIRVKYQPQLKNRFGWGLSIDVAGTADYPLESMTGVGDGRTADEVYSDLYDLAIAPGIFIYEDIDGRQYEVRTQGGSFPYTKAEYNARRQRKEWNGVWNLQIEQATEEEYDET